MFGKIFAKLFPIWAVLGAFLGYAYPDVFVPARGLIVPMLMLVMLSMGLTLTARNFVEVASYKWALLLGVFLQFTVMPLTALLLSHTLDLNSDLLIGMLLVGSVAGGTASNVMTYLARGHLALSVSMTAFSTLASVALTPLLLTLYLGTSVSVPAYDMLLSLIKIIVIPISIGVLLNTVLAQRVAKLTPLFTPVSITLIAIIIATVVALNADKIAVMGANIAIASLAHNVLGLTIGYIAARLLGFSAPIRRTIALEVGMQNSGLATALALKYFSAAAALPGAIFSVWLNVTGSIFAVFCRVKDESAQASRT